MIWGIPIRHPTGVKLSPLTSAGSQMKGCVDRIYDEEDIIGHELASNAALFEGDYQIVMDGGPVSQKQWHLLNIVAGPGETIEFREEMPDRFQDMLEACRAFVADNNVRPVAEDDTQKKAMGHMLKRPSQKS